MAMNVAMRQAAIANGFKLSDAGLYKTSGGPTEKLTDSLSALAKLTVAKKNVSVTDIFKAFGCKFVKPEDREPEKISGLF